MPGTSSLRCTRSSTSSRLSNSSSSPNDSSFATSSAPSDSSTAKVSFVSSSEGNRKRAPRASSTGATNMYNTRLSRNALVKSLRSNVTVCLIDIVRSLTSLHQLALNGHIAEDKGNHVEQ